MNIQILLQYFFKSSNKEVLLKWWPIRYWVGVETACQLWSNKRQKKHLTYNGTRAFNSIRLSRYYCLLVQYYLSVPCPKGIYTVELSWFIYANTKIKIRFDKQNRSEMRMTSGCFVTCQIKRCHLKHYAVSHNKTTSK